MPKKRLKIVADKPARLKLVKDSLPGTKQPAPLTPEAKAEMVKTATLGLFFLGKCLFDRVTDVMADKVASRIRRNKSIGK